MIWVPPVEKPSKAFALRLVLTDDGTLYSRGVAMYGSTGHGGARDVGGPKIGRCSTMVGQPSVSLLLISASQIL